MNTPTTLRKAGYTGTDTALRVVAMCLDLGGDMLAPRGYAVERTHAGWSQRSAGAWSWWLHPADDYTELVGGYYSVRDLWRAHRTGTHGGKPVYVSVSVGRYSTGAVLDLNRAQRAGGDRHE